MLLALSISENTAMQEHCSQVFIPLHQKTFRCCKPKIRLPWVNFIFLLQAEGEEDVSGIVLDHLSGLTF